MPRSRNPPVCDTCGQVTTWVPSCGFGPGYFTCAQECSYCHICDASYRKDDPGCADCVAARKRGDEGFCSGGEFLCGAPMVAVGIPPVYVCKNGCAVCPECTRPVPFGQGCSSCHPPPPGQRFDDMDDDIPF